MEKTNSSASLQGAVKAKIRSIDLLLVSGKRYEWNETFSCYWSVSGDPVQLQNKDIVGVKIFDARLYQKASDVANALGHTSEKSFSTLKTIQVEDIEYDLRVCSVGKESYFEWIDSDGDVVGDMFFEFDGVESASQELINQLSADKMTAGDWVVFNSSDRTGMKHEYGIILRPLTDQEADLHDVGLMFKVRLLNGLVVDAFAGELTLSQPSTTPDVRFPRYSKWRHGGWYVHGVPYPTGCSGCVSNKYPDKKWRIVCDYRRKDIGGEGDFTYPSRDDAAKAEYALAIQLTISTVLVADGHYCVIDQCDDSLASVYVYDADGYSHQVHIDLSSKTVKPSSPSSFAARSLVVANYDLFDARIASLNQR